MILPQMNCIVYLFGISLISITAIIWILYSLYYTFYMPACFCNYDITVNKCTYIHET